MQGNPWEGGRRGEREGEREREREREREKEGGRGPGGKESDVHVNFIHLS